MVLFVGCQEERSYTTLIQYPDVLKEEIAKCENRDVKSQEDTTWCETVMNTASTLSALRNEWQADPEAFGQRILDAEIAYVMAKDRLLKAQQLLKEQDEKQTPAKRKTALNQVDTAMQQYRNAEDEMTLLLAVVGMESPK